MTLSPLALLLGLATTAWGRSPLPPRSIDPVIERVERMSWDAEANALVRAQGLSLVNVTWEDTARYDSSVWGPNISDMTIGVRDSRGELHPMPVIRYDNFLDRSADVRADRFSLLVGNARGEPLRPVSLVDVLRHTRSYLHDPSSWAGWRSSLWAPRDEHVLVSAQACLLPVPRHGEATFTPVIYNYQSRPGDPAVLTIVATREGTSIQVVENRGGYLSEVLTFNEDGQRAPFVATRVSDSAGASAAAAAAGSAEDAGLNVVLLIQVPLKQRHPQPWPPYLALDDMALEAAPPAAGALKSARKSDVESAVISHGETEGPYEEIGGLAIERDPRYPVRVTVQFYQATSNGVIDAADVARFRSLIERVYADADFVGSLVVGPHWRPTDWQAPQPVIPEAEASWAEGSWSWLKSR